jgi:hypothetical protein
MKENLKLSRKPMHRILHAIADSTLVNLIGVTYTQYEVKYDYKKVPPKKGCQTENPCEIISRYDNRKNLYSFGHGVFAGIIVTIEKVMCVSGTCLRIAGYEKF